MLEQAITNKCKGRVPTFRIRYPFNESGSFDGPVTVEPRGTINLLGLDAFFVLFTSFAHFVYFVDACIRKDDMCCVHNYTLLSISEAVPLSINIRYFEYSISASVMAVLIAASVGIVDDLLLMTLGILVATVMLFGHIQDVIYRNVKIGMESSLCIIHLFDISRYKLRWLAFSLGCVPYMIYWVIVFWVYAENVKGENVPVLVHTIVFSMFVMFSMFAVVQFYFEVLHEEQVNYEFINMRRADIWLHWLSFFSKFMLAFFVWGGLQRLSIC